MSDFFNKFFIKTYQSQQGISLVQVMVVAALLGGLSIMMMRLISNQQKVSQKMVADADLNQFQNVMMGLLNRERTCTRALGGVDKGTDLSSLSFNEDTSDLFISLGENVANASYRVESIRVLDDTEAAAASLNVVDNLVHLRVRLRQQREVIGGRDKFLYFSVTGDVGVINFYSASTQAAAETQCSSVGGEVAEITEDPSLGYTAQCHVPSGDMIILCGV